MFTLVNFVVMALTCAGLGLPLFTVPTVGIWPLTGRVSVPATGDAGVMGRVAEASDAACTS